MRRAKILIVEDEIIVADDIKNNLEKHGYKIASLAASGEKALQIAEKENPDLVLMDIVLKGELDGINAADQIRKQFGIPVIFLTAYSNNEIFQSAKITEPFGYITKPFDTKQLILNIEIALYKSEMEEELKKREAFNFALFEYNPIETIVVDREGKIIKTNLAKMRSGNRLPKTGDIMYKDYAGKHKIDMFGELMKSIKTNKVKKFPEKKYGNKFLSITISPFPQGAIIISQDITMSKKDEEELKKSKLKLQRQKSVLEQKNIALREVLGQIEVEKKAVEDNIMANVNKMILPVLEKMKLKDESDEYAEFINLIEHFSKKLSSSFGREITKTSLKLTPREIEICTLIENGLINKEISTFLNISYLTVDDHRKKIRKKLGITNKRINLTTFLKNLSS